jgi:type I restriction enzyme S subunit
MKVELKAYPDYKECRVCWLGDMPCHWSLWKVSRSFRRIGSGTTPLGTVEDYYRDATNVWVNTGDLNDGVVSESATMLSDFALQKHSTLKLYPKGALLVAMYGATIGKIGILDVPASVNQACCVLAEPIRTKTKYNFYWFLANRKAIVSLSYGGTQPNISQQTIRSLYINVPPLSEQDTIVTFLDRETAKIDRLMEVRRKQVERLQEQRSAVIHHAVTQGLDPHAPMKPSGIEWLGDVPEHWRVVPLLDVLKERKVRNIGNQESNLLSLSYGRIIRKDAEDNFGLLPESFETYQIVEPGNIVVRLLDLQNDKRSLRVGYVEEKGIVTSAYLALEAAPGQSPFYLSQLLHSYDLWKVFYGIGGGVRQSINYTDIRRLPVPVPPVSEQVVLTAAIKRANDKLDTLAAKYRRELELLAEYRASLISHAVTGKIDVRGLAEPSPL